MCYPKLAVFEPCPKHCHLLPLFLPPFEGQKTLQISDRQCLAILDGRIGTHWQSATKLPLLWQSLAPIRGAQSSVGTPPSGGFVALGTASRQNSDKDLRSLLLALWFAGMVAPCPLMFAFDRRLGVKRVLGPGVLGVASAEVFSHLVVGGRPEAPQIVGDLDGSIVRSE